MSTSRLGVDLASGGGAPVDLAHRVTSPRDDPAAEVAGELRVVRHHADEHGVKPRGRRVERCRPLREHRPDVATQRSRVGRGDERLGAGEQRRPHECGTVGPAPVQHRLRRSDAFGDGLHRDGRRPALDEELERGRVGRRFDLGAGAPGRACGRGLVAVHREILAEGCEAFMEGRILTIRYGTVSKRRSEGIHARDRDRRRNRRTRHRRRTPKPRPRGHGDRALRDHRADRGGHLDLRQRLPRARRARGG